MFGIALNNKSPIHEQLTNRITELVLSGVLEPDSALPSVRELAADLGINPNTVQKAYGELERRGVTYSVTGKGRFVTGNVNKVKEEKKLEAIERLKAEIENALAEGVTYDEIRKMLEEDI